MPIVTCPKNEIIEEKDPSVDIEEIANVYYINGSQWFAINDSWVRYTCKRDNDIMVEKLLELVTKVESCLIKGPIVRERVSRQMFHLKFSEHLI
jgi:hypothetical protein